MRPGGWLFAFDASFLERGERALFPNASHGADIYIWDFTRASRKAGSRGRERRAERKRERTSESRLAGSSHAIRCILPTSYNSFFALLLVSRVYPARQRHEPFGGEALIMRVQSTRERHEDHFGDRESISPCRRGHPSMCQYVRTHTSLVSVTRSFSLSKTSGVCH